MFRGLCQKVEFMTDEFNLHWSTILLSAEEIQELVNYEEGQWLCLEIDSYQEMLFGSNSAVSNQRVYLGFSSLLESALDFGQKVFLNFTSYLLGWFT